MSVGSKPILRVVACGLFLGLAGCLNAPEVDDRVSETVMEGGYPALVPLDSIFTELPQDAATSQTKDLEARIRRLEARAEQLRAPVIDPAARRRLDDKVGG